jgi:predicted metal-dependent HD superfamily phosphohydrolase
VPGHYVVKSFDGMLIDFAKRENCRTLVRGIRAITDTDVESQLAHVNREQSIGDLETILLPSKQEFMFVSSSAARQLASLGGVLTAYLPPKTAAAWRDRIAPKHPVTVTTNAIQVTQHIGLLWQEVSASFSIDPQKGTELVEKLLKAYNEPHRAYHTQQHLEELSQILLRHSSGLKDKTAVYLAALAHDVVYDTTRSDNEERSADWARNEFGKLGVCQVTIDRVAELVMVTKTHRAAPGDNDAEVLLNSDLAILGASPSRYQEYATQVAQEFKHVPDYRGRRMQFLKSHIPTADRPLFTLPAFKAAYEEAAKRNMQAEADALA